MNNKITIIIHGTWFPLISSVIHKMDCPYGLTKACDLKEHLTLNKIAKCLNTNNPEEYPMETIYAYGWSGAFSAKERKEAAKQLLSYLNFQSGSVDIIAHSHGCNVALNLAKHIEEFNKNIKIDKLILLACPVQLETKNLVNSNCFNKVFHFYSKQDVAQVIDPQGIYTKIPNTEVPLFSERTFNLPKVHEAAIFFNKKAIEHNDFFLEKFISKLDVLLNLVENNKESNLNFDLSSL